MELQHRLADRFRRVPKVVWGFVVVTLAFGVNAAWVTRPDSPYSYYLSRPDIEIANLKIEKRKLTRRVSRVTPVKVTGELTNRSSRTVTAIDLGVTVYSCRTRDGPDFSDCKVAFEATISPVVRVAPNETRPFDGTFYVSQTDPPVRPTIRLGHKVHFVHTK